MKSIIVVIALAICCSTTFGKSFEELDEAFTKGFQEGQKMAESLLSQTKDVSFETDTGLEQSLEKSATNGFQRGQKAAESLQTRSDSKKSSVNNAYKEIVNLNYLEIGLLEVSTDTYDDSLNFHVVIDNATISNIQKATTSGAIVYAIYYNQNGWPDKTVVYVNNAGESQIGVGRVYSKWINDLGVDTTKNEGNMKLFYEKVINATSIWEWNL